jgi:phage shock protein A/lia operon protein LiaH
MFIKRIRTSLETSLDKFVDQIENHEALTSAHIKQLQVELGQAQVQYLRLQKEGDQLEAQLNASKEQTSLWRQRSKNTQEESEALECLKRSRRRHEDSVRLETSLSDQRMLEQKLATDLGRLKDGYESMKRQRQALKARESRACAVKVTQQLENQESIAIQDSFERWEERLVEKEVLVGSTQIESRDQLELKYEEREEHESLLNELKQLRLEEPS